MADVPINFPLWTLVSATGHQEIAADSEGNPVLPVWTSDEEVLKIASAGRIVVPLLPVDLVDRLRQMPGDSMLLVLGVEKHFRLPAKRALVDMQAAVDQFDPGAYVATYRGLHAAINRGVPVETAFVLRAAARELAEEWAQRNGGDVHELHKVAFAGPEDDVDAK